MKKREAYEGYMGYALKEAQKAFEKDEVPVGAVVVLNDKIIARGHNTRESTFDPTGHAEIVALRRACQRLGSWRLTDTTVYVNIEPCIMCMGALLQARVLRLIFGAFDPKGGAAGSLFDLSCNSRLNHCIEVISGVQEEKSKELLQSFFKKLRG
ncbi:MAG: tRNA adenosine(34) deaminase TadA [Thermodesulfobacteriota bacterium]